MLDIFMIGIKQLQAWCFVFYFLFYIIWIHERNELEKGSYSYLIYSISQKISNINGDDLHKGIWPLIDQYNNKLKKFVNISNGSYDTIFGLFKAFAGDKLFCPILEGFDIYLFM